MKALSLEECSMVSGAAAGVLTVFAVGYFIYTERNNIRDFVDGIFEGYEENQAKHRQAEGGKQ